MTSPYQQPLCITVGSSRLLHWGLLLMHSFVIIVVLGLFSLGLMVNIVLTISIVVSYLLYYRQHVSRTAINSIQSVCCSLRSTKGLGVVWTVSFQNERESQQQLLSSSFISKWLAVLVFCDSDKHISSFVIPFDGVDKNSFRRLRVIVDHFQKN